MYRDKTLTRIKWHSTDILPVVSELWKPQGCTTHDVRRVQGVGFRPSLFLCKI